MMQAMSIDNVASTEPVDPAAAARAFRAALIQFVRSKIADRHEAEDIVQEVLLRLHRSVEQLRAQQLVGPWLFQIARNVIIDYYRARGRKPDAVSLDDEIADAGALAEEFPSAGFTQRDATRCLAGFVEALPSPMAEALRLVDLEGLTHREVAQRTGLSIPGIKSRVQRARSAVREAVVRCCELDFSHPQGLVEYLPTQAPACPPKCSSTCLSDGCGPKASPDAEGS
jgi:RNA polymerase sigma-70 factor (ECF subfamily)